MKKIIAFLITTFFIVNVNAQCWSKISSGYNGTTLAIKTDGSLWGWGFNNVGQVGVGSTETTINISQQVATEYNWALVSVGSFHTLAIKTDGTLWGWGSNFYGALGNGTNVNSNVPIQAGTYNDWYAVEAGQDYFSLAIKKNGTLWGWGKFYGFNSTTPFQIGTDNNWASISASQNHALAIKRDGTLWAWGANDAGQLGDGTNTAKTTPIEIGTGKDWAAVSAGGFYGYIGSFSLALKKDGTLWAWGSNFSGQLGNGTKDNKNVPTQIGTGTIWAAVSTGGGHVLALKTDGTLWGWGENGGGGLGDGTNIDKTIPVQTGTSVDWGSFCAGYGISFGIKSNNSLWAWGSGNYGDGNNSQQNTPLQITICGTLPIRLVTFTGQQYLHTSLLNWQTTNEINTSHFMVQRSANGTTFNNNGTVEAKNTSGTNDYNLTDASPLDGVNFYRLQMVDIDRKTTYSSIIKIVFAGKSELQVFPNPAKNSITVSGLQNKGTIKIISSDGKVVNQIEVAANTSKIDVSTLAKGIYLLQYNGGKKGSS